jgi:hypothetical protein
MPKHSLLQAPDQTGRSTFPFRKKAKSTLVRFLSLATATALLTTGITSIATPEPAEASYMGLVTSSFKVTEKTQRYVSGRFQEVLVETGSVEFQHPNQVLCLYSTCSMTYSYRYLPVGDSWDYFNFSLFNVSSGTTSSLGYLSRSTSWQTREYTFTPTAGVNSYLQFRITNLSSNETAESINPATYFISADTLDLFFLNPDISPTATSLRTGKVYYGEKFKIFEYGFPTRVNVSSGCMNIPVAVAAVDLASGWKDNGQVWAQSTFVVSVKDKRGNEIATTTLQPNSWDWSTRVIDDKLLVEVCGLVDERKKERQYRFEGKFSTTQYGITASIDLRQNAVFRGVTKYTTINCLKGDNVRVVRAAVPVCPENFEETKLRVANGKLVLTTIKCLKGVDVINVTAPEPSCPGGYTRTTLPTKNGKIKSTITCVKGLNAIKVKNFSPKCPVGFKEFEDS